MIGRKLLIAALGIGALADGGVALLALFFQPLLGPILDVPTKDPAIATFLGGELAVVAVLYVAIACNLDRFRPLLWIVALDQVFAAGLPLVEMLRGHVAVTLKTAGPIPISLALAAIFVAGAVGPAARAQKRAPRNTPA